MAQNPPEKVAPLFPDDERRKIVRSFVDAYIRGKVEIRHFGEPGKPEDTGMKMKVLHMIEAVVGGKLPGEQVQTAIDGLFTCIVAFRMGDRIEGEFLEVPVDFESRLSSVETKVNSELEAISRILSLLVQWIITYQPVLDEAAKDYADKARRIKET